jgi:hypothetical protein
MIKIRLSFLSLEKCVGAGYKEGLRQTEISMESDTLLIVSISLVVLDSTYQPVEAL